VLAYLAIVATLFIIIIQAIQSKMNGKQRKEEKKKSELRERSKSDGEKKGEGAAEKLEHSMGSVKIEEKPKDPSASEVRINVQPQKPMVG
jgi:uncharacterized membrane protein YhiD involved in acid resistance